MVVLFGIDNWAVKNAQVRADGKNQGTPAQSNTVKGNENTTGNINQNGSNNNAVIGSGNSVGNTTYNVRGPKTSGWLLPGSDPIPPGSYCAAENIKRDPKAVALFYGGSIAVTSSFPRDVLVVKDVPRLVVDRESKNGGVSITADIFGADGKIVASIEHNKFTVNPNNYFTMEAHRSALNVIDQYKKQVLSVRYLNPHAIKFNAILYYPGLDAPIEIKDDVLSIGDFVWGQLHRSPTTRRSCHADSVLQTLPPWGHCFSLEDAPPCDRPTPDACGKH